MRCYDQIHVQAVINQIDGYTHDRTKWVGVPALFGTNFQAVSVGEKLYADPVTGQPGGYQMCSAHRPRDWPTSLISLTNHLGASCDELRTQNLYQLDIDHRQRQARPVADRPHEEPKYRQRSTQPPCSAASEAFDISDDGSLIWLADSSLTSSVVSILSQPQNQQLLGIQEIFAGQSLINKFNSPLHDARTPDIILKVNTGVIFTGGNKIAEHGGFNEDDVHTALLLSMDGMQGAEVKAATTNQQVAPTISGHSDSTRRASTRCDRTDSPYCRSSSSNRFRIRPHDSTLHIMQGAPGSWSPLRRLACVGRHCEIRQANRRVNYCGKCIQSEHRRGRTYLSRLTGPSLMAPEPHRSLESLRSAAIELHTRQDFANAEGCYRQALEIGPRDFQALLMFGVLSAQTGNLHQAEELLKQAIAVNSGSPQAFNNLGIVFTDLQRYAGAVACFDAALALAPDYAEALFTVGRLSHQRRFDEALASYDQALRSIPVPRRPSTIAAACCA